MIKEIKVMRMITNDEILEFMRETAYKPMTYQELEKQFKIENAEQFKLFLKMLNELEEEGEIIRTRGERYGVPERMNLLRGQLQVHQKGFAFLLPADKTNPDVYIHANSLLGGMNKDTVLARINPKEGSGDKRVEGEVVRIIKRANDRIVGTFEEHGAYAFVIPDDKRIVRDVFIPKEAFHNAVIGTKVVVRLVQYPEGRAAAQGEVIEVLGHKEDPGVDIMSVIRKYGVPETFPEEGLN